VANSISTAHPQILRPPPIKFVRLDPTERKALKSALAGIAAERVFLFGSRVDDAARGGDIDILVYSKADPLKLSRKVATLDTERIGWSGTLPS
jgi:predicted nucleotidyltransferase